MSPLREAPTDDVMQDEDVGSAVVGDLEASIDDTADGK
jgi:hypothetical protein